MSSEEMKYTWQGRLACQRRAESELVSRLSTCLVSALAGQAGEVLEKRKTEVIKILISKPFVKISSYGSHTGIQI